jgi:hypothetical protein
LNLEPLQGPPLDRQPISRLVDWTRYKRQLTRMLYSATDVPACYACCMSLDDVLTENAQTRAKARPLVRAALEDVAARRNAAEAALAEVVAEFEDLVTKAFEGEILSVQEITAATGVPRSRVYQIAKRAAATQSATA